MVAGIAVALLVAHDAIVDSIRTIPDAALDWRPDDADWPLKYIISHLAHANDFYVMIVDEAGAADFRSITLRPELAGFQAMAETDTAVAHCTTVAAALACFERTYQRLLARLDGLSLEELDRPFTIAYTWQPEAPPETTTLRQRVVEMAARHLREHQVQIEETLARWQSVPDPQPGPGS